MNKNIVNILISVIIIFLLIYLLYTLILPKLYDKEFIDEGKYKGIENEEEIRIVNECLAKYVDACANFEEAKVKDMLPIINKLEIKDYSNIFDLYSENEITSSDQCIVYNIKKLSNNIYQVYFYLKSGNIVDGLLYDTVTIQIKNISHSFKILYDKNLYI